MVEYRSEIRDCIFSKSVNCRVQNKTFTIWFAITFATAFAITFA
jgi:hypothetical protein